MHRRVHFRRHYKKNELNTGIMICVRCHKGIHKRFDEMTLAKSYNTLARLREDPDLAKHFQWVSRQKEQR
ncbi:hypothetical protein N9C27_01120 [Luminiphilus sp.]|nr:hypothetical protein [Luminiphilus sp.]MDA8773192.1 hypothetical protein [Luminiphilus sp.]MDA9580174.1 hypothetical protein [Luminiphilus sp.]MDA9847455.1 hypothetical protein [Luminiphilus sp.]MDB2352704.1 hypothetical protein [Luminiphilus sp.]